MPWGWRVSEYEETFELRPGLGHLAAALLGALMRLGRREPGHGIGRMKLLDNPFWPQYARRDLASIAADRGQDPLDAVYDLLLGAVEAPHRLMVIIHAYTEDEQREAFVHPLCVPGSDATTLAPDGPLADSWFHGAYTWASWFYRFMVRDERLLTPAQAVHKLTAQPAAFPWTGW